MSRRIFIALAAALAALEPGTVAQAGEPNADLMLARPCPKPEACLQTWTLTSRLGHMLAAYESRLGRRNSRHRILGIEFTTTGRPRTWYPNFAEGQGGVIVQLTQQARYNRGLAMFQLGHEVFHLIEPIEPKSSSSYFEEGLASYFALAYLDAEDLASGDAYLTEKSYRLAFDLVKRIADLHADFYPRLKRFREINRSFSRISAGDIIAAFPKAPASVAEQLAQPFGTASHGTTR